MFAEEIWGLPKENVIGSAPAYEYTDGRIVRTDRMLGGLALGPGKPEHIYAQTARLPLFAGGNADVDIEMLTVATFALLVNHDDADREYAYTKAAENSLAKGQAALGRAEPRTGRPARHLRPHLLPDRTDPGRHPDPAVQRATQR